MIFGILNAIAFFLAAGKFLTRRIGNPTLDRGALYVHRFAGTALLVLTVLHMCGEWGRWGLYPKALLITGLLMSAGVAALVWSHICAKKLRDRWLTIHHTATLLILFCLPVHIFLRVAAG